MHWICGPLMWKFNRLLDALWRPLFLATKSSWSQLGTSSKLDSGRLKLNTKSLRNLTKKYAFRPEPNLELFQVQIRTDLYFLQKLHVLHCIFGKIWFFTKIKRKIFFSFLTIFLKISFLFNFHRILMKKFHFGQVSGGGDTSDPRVASIIVSYHEKNVKMRFWAG